MPDGHGRGSGDVGPPHPVRDAAIARRTLRRNGPVFATKSNTADRNGSASDGPAVDEPDVHRRTVLDRASFAPVSERVARDQPRLRDHPTKPLRMLWWRDGIQRLIPDRRRLDDIRYVEPPGLHVGAFVVDRAPDFLATPFEGVGLGGIGRWCFCRSFSSIAV